MGTRLFTARGVGAAEDPRSPKGAPSSGPLRRSREAGALLLFAVSVFLCLALASLRMDVNDPSVTGTDWVGPVGAAVAGKAGVQPAGHHAGVDLERRQQFSDGAPPLDIQCVVRRQRVP